MSDTKDLGEELASLALEIVDEAKGGPLGQKVSLETKIDAFKAVSAYHVAHTRAKMKLPATDENPGVDFDVFRAAVNQAKAGEGGVGGDGGGTPTVQ